MSSHALDTFMSNHKQHAVSMQIITTFICEQQLAIILMGCDIKCWDICVSIYYDNSCY